MAKFCCTLTLAIPPQRGNTRLHWAELKRAEDRWTRRAIVDLANSRQCPPEPLASYSIHCLVYSKRLMDRDNATAILKKPIDLLCGLPKKVKGHGIIYRTPRWFMGDSPDYLKKLDVEPARDWDNPRLELHLCTHHGL